MTYQGNLRTSAIHLASQHEITTDAPIDNNGKGASFSPTDLVATALASCMITIMGIRAETLDIDITGAKASITKIMSSDPRKIAEVQVIINMPTKAYEAGHRKILESAAKTCPVALSLHPDIRQSIEFVWHDAT